MACKIFNEKHQSLFDKVVLLKDLDFNDTDIINIEKLLKTRNQIINFCKKNKIDLIECHPFQCSLSAVLAAEKLQIPISYTLHGVASGDFINPTKIGLRASYYLALKYGFDQIFAVAEYLHEQYSYLSSNILIARNGTNLDNYKVKNRRRPNGNFCITSRLDIPKTQLILDFLPTLHKLDSVKKIDIFGDGESSKILIDFIKNHNLSKVYYHGWQENPVNNLSSNNYDAVFGMGRVILDAIKSNTPAGILGYGGFAGFINHHNLSYFMKNNLTDWKNHNNLDLKQEIDNLYKNPDSYIMTKKEIESLDSTTIWHDFIKTEKLLKFSEKPVIKTINYILEKTPSPTLNLNDFILTTNFENLQNDIIYQTFRDYIYSSIKNDSEINSLKNSLNQITTSRFWKNTELLRQTLNVIHNKKMSKNKTTNNPEIIAVLCVYNEALNIAGCLSHIEKYVDKIVILDDKSTDETIKIAKKCPKVIKILQNRHKTFWNERQNRQKILETAYRYSKRKNPWVLCIDADERLETSFLQNLRKIAKEYQDNNSVIALRFRELWDSPSYYREDGVWDEKRKAIFFKLQSNMTFNYQQEHRIPWYYQELQGNEVLLDYNIYHLKMIKEVDRKNHADLYNRLDPEKKMQPIGYDYLTDTTNIKLKKIPKSKNYDASTIPDYYL